MQGRTLDIGSANEAVEFDVSALTDGRVQYQRTNVSGNYTVTLQYSIDHINWYGFSSAITFTQAEADELTDNIDLASIRYLRAVVTSAGTSGTVAVRFFGKDNRGA